MENPKLSNYKNKNIETKYLSNMQKTIFKGKELPFRVIKRFIELKDRELKNRETKIKREIEELFFKLITASIDDIDKLEQKEIKKIRPVRNNWYDWLINFKDRVVCFFKRKSPKH